MARRRRECRHWCAGKRRSPDAIRPAETRAFHIELAAEMADTRADELFEYVEHVVVAEGLIKGWMMPFGAFEPA